MLTTPGQLQNDRDVRRTDVTIATGLSMWAAHTMLLFHSNGMLLLGESNVRLLGNDILWSEDER